MSAHFQVLSPEQYARISQLLDQSIELPPSERNGWITELGLRDPEAAALLRRLFASQQESVAARFLEDPPLILPLSPEAQGAPTLAGRQLGPYRILSLLGHGGMGSVWLAERVDGLFSRQVALKLVHPALMGAMLTERLGREREILASLNHAHIARLLDAGFGEDGQPYLAIEYIAGKPLTRYADELQLSVTARLALFMQILSAVQYAHARGIIHRDLKPSNILVTQEGSVQLLDFGIAKLLTDGVARETELTLLGGRALTPDYAAPEQVAGAPITTAADVYSLGVIFYELMTGERPYRLKRVSRGALEEAILSAEPVAPSGAPISRASAAARATTPKGLAKALAGDLDTIALKALKKVPAERYATANAFDEDIARYLRGDVVLAQTDSLAYRVRKFARRHRLGVGVASLLVLILGAGLVGTSYEAKLASAQRDEARQAQQRLLTQAAAARLKSGDIHGAMGIILEVLPQHVGDRAMSPEALNVFEGARAADAAVLALAGHTERVNFASFSPDAGRVVTASNDNTAGVWDATSGRRLLTLTGHTAPLTAAEFSSDGQRITTAAIDGSARVWDALSGHELLQLRGQGDHVNTATFSPDGSRILTASDDKHAYLWDSATGRLLRTFAGHTDRVASAYFSPDGRRIVTASDDKTAILWDAASGRLLRIFSGHTDRAWFAAFSPDGRRIVTASYDKTARIWDVANGRELVRLVGHTAPVSSAVFSPDGRYVATAGTDSRACIWDARSGRLLQTLSGHTDRVWSAMFSSDSRRIVTASDDRTARIWQVEPRDQIYVLRGHTAPITSAHFSRDGQRVVTTSDDATARVWDASSGRELQRFTGHTAPVVSAAFSPDGARIVTASTDRTARIWDVSTARELVRFTGHTDQVTYATFSHDGKRVATASTERFARVWDAATGQELALMKGHTDLVGSVAFSPDDTRILTASSDQTARVWDARTGRPLQVLRGHTGQIWSAEFSSDGRRVLTASSDHTARLWDAASGVETERLEGLSDNVSSAAFSPDSAQVVTSLDDQTARIWDLASGRQTLALVGHTDALQFAAFAPDGLRVVTASDDATARIWDVQTPALDVQLAWAGAAQFDSPSSTQRYELGLPQPADVRAWPQAHTPCDEAAGAPEDPDRVSPGVRSADIVADVAIAACARATRDAPDVARSHFEYARALLAAAQLPAARTELEQAVARGYRAARIELAQLLAQHSSAADAARALALDEKAWNAGDTLAAFELGAMYEHGEHRDEAMGGDPHQSNERLAWQWYGRGAEALEPHAAARLAERDEQAAATATSVSERDRHWLEALGHYASAAETARREDWPDGAWRIWRLRRASLARLLALDGQMPEVASAFNAVRERR